MTQIDPYSINRRCTKAVRKNNHSAFEWHYFWHCKRHRAYWKVEAKRRGIPEFLWENILS